VLGTAHESQRVAAQEVDAAVGQICGEARDAVVDGAEKGKRGLTGNSPPSRRASSSMRMFRSRAVADVLLVTRF